VPQFQRFPQFITNILISNDAIHAVGRLGALIPNQAIVLETMALTLKENRFAKVRDHGRVGNAPIE
jgi:hypothetical protein